MPTATVTPRQQSQIVMDRLREQAESAGIKDHCGVLAGPVEDAPVGVVMCLADQCSVDYSALFSDR